jgi:spermidine synthase
VSDAPAPPPELPALVAPAVDLEGAVPGRRILLRQPGAFGDVVVVEEDGLVLLRFGSEDGADQSAIDPRQPRRVIFEYVRIAAVGPALRTDGRPFRRALMLGLGGGAWPRLVLETERRVVVDAVELDPVVVDVARRFFALPQSPRLNVIVDDAAHYVARADVREGRYDVIFLDAFSGDDMPAALSTPTFFRQLRHLLTDDGVLMVNVALVSDRDAATIIDRLTMVFPDCSWARAKQEENQIVFAAKRPITTDAVRRAAIEASAKVGFDVAKDIDRVESCSGLAPAPPGNDVKLR